MSALFRVRGARIALAGETLLAPGDTEANGTLVVLVGRWEPLFRLLTGEAELAAGSLDVASGPATTALAERRLGVARADPPLPESYDVTGYLTASARLLGLDKRDARRAALEVLESLGLGKLGKARLGRLLRAERRALALAQAVLGNPPALAVERPFDALGDDEALALERLLERVRAGRSLLLQLGSRRESGPGARALSSADVTIAVENRSAVQAPPLANGHT